MNIDTNQILIGYQARRALGWVVRETARLFPMWWTQFRSETISPSETARAIAA